MKDLTKKIDWKKLDGLVPVIIQNYQDGSILMHAYMNEEALKKTIDTSQVTFFSRSKKRLWTKGETSRKFLNLKSIYLDCDNDTLLALVDPVGDTCHLQRKTCFKDNPSFDNHFLDKLFELIESRKKEMPKDSYTTFLFENGTDKICEKVDEESAEVIQAAQKETKQRLIEESSDLIYHLFVLMAEKSITLDQVTNELKKRNK